MIKVWYSYIVSRRITYSEDEWPSFSTWSNELSPIASRCFKLHLFADSVTVSFPAITVSAAAPVAASEKASSYWSLSSFSAAATVAPPPLMLLSSSPTDCCMTKMVAVSAAKMLPPSGPANPVVVSCYESMDYSESDSEELLHASTCLGLSIYVRPFALVPTP